MKPYVLREAERMAKDRAQAPTASCLPRAGRGLRYGRGHKLRIGGLSNP